MTVMRPRHEKRLVRVALTAVRSHPTYDLPLPSLTRKSSPSLFPPPPRPFSRVPFSAPTFPPQAYVPASSWSVWTISGRYRALRTARQDKPRTPSVHLIHNVPLSSSNPLIFSIATSSNPRIHSTSSQTP